jgi:hypothetical protein
MYDVSLSTESSAGSYRLSFLLFIGYWLEILYGSSPEVGNTFRIVIHSRKTVYGGGFLSRSEERKCIER